MRGNLVHREVLAEDEPLAADFANSEFVNNGLAVANGEGGAEFILAFAAPGEFEGAGADGGLESVLRLVGGQVAIQFLGSGESGAKECTKECQ